MFEHSPSDRMQLAGLGELVHPASCMVCGSGNCEEGYVSLGVWYEFEGTQYLCRTCCVQAAEILGCLIPEEATVLQDLVEATTTELAAIKEELKDTHERLTIYDGVIARASAITGTSSSSSGSGVSQDFDGSSEVAATGEPVTAEPVKSTGRSNSKSLKSSDSTESPIKL